MAETQQLIFTDTPAEALDRWLDQTGATQIFILTDENTAGLVWPRLREASFSLDGAHLITIKAGDGHKNLQSLSAVWQAMGENGGTRKSVLVNLGGGVVTDLGGFAAATFKRGIRFVNIPTTLLSAVDAAVGGKTGINFNGLKNEIGAFCNADAVIISTIYFSTLPPEEMLSGYAEMLKHGLIADEKMYGKLIGFDIAGADLGELLDLLRENVMVKKRVVEEDPTEKGLRRALNLGHTSGHAFESWSMARKKTVPHGYAVAWGLVVDLVLSHLRLGFPAEELRRVAAFVSDNYGPIGITCHDYDALVELMRHDKKNSSVNEINFTLLDAPGKIHLDCTATPDEIKTALDLFRDLMHI